MSFRINKFEVYKLKSENEGRKELFESIETILEDKIWEMLNKMGSSKKNINVIQSLISETMSEFKTKISSESESDWDHYNPSMKSENLNSLSNNMQKYKHSWNSSESRDTSNSNKRIAETVYSAQVISSRSKWGPKQNRNSSNLTMKSITNKSNNQNLDKERNMHKVSSSLKHMNSLKPRKGKYLNYIEPNKNEERHQIK